MFSPCISFLREFTPRHNWCDHHVFLGSHYLWNCQHAGDPIHRPCSSPAHLLHADRQVHAVYSNVAPILGIFGNTACQDRCWFSRRFWNLEWSEFCSEDMLEVAESNSCQRGYVSSTNYITQHIPEVIPHSAKVDRLIEVEIMRQR